MFSVVYCLSAEDDLHKYFESSCLVNISYYCLKNFWFNIVVHIVMIYCMVSHYHF